MNFCPNCQNILEIINNNKNNINNANNSQNQEGGNSEVVENETTKNITNIIKNIINGKTSDIDKSTINIKNILDSNYFKKLSHNDKNKIHNFLKDNDDNLYFNCNNCKYKELIPDGTLLIIQSQIETAKLYETKQLQNMSYSDILRHTRKYICPNSKCKSHDDPSLKNAVFFRRNNTYKVTYICKTCETAF